MRSNNSKPKKNLGGFVTENAPNKEKHSKFKKGLMPAPQLIMSESANNASVEVGKRRFQLQGNARTITDELRKNPDTTFKAMTLETDEHWRIGKENIKISISPKGESMADLDDYLLSNLKNVVLNAVITPGINGGVIAIAEGGIDIVDSVDFTNNIVAENSKQTKSKKSSANTAKTVMKSDNGPIVNPESTLGTLRRFKDFANRIFDNIGNTIGGPVGKSVASIAHTDIIVKIDSYIQPSRSGLTLDMGKTEVTAKEIANLVEGLVLGQKNIENSSLILDQMTHPHVEIGDGSQKQQEITNLAKNIKFLMQENKLEAQDALNSIITANNLNLDPKTASKAIKEAEKGKPKKREVSNKKQLKV